MKMSFKNTWVALPERSVSGIHPRRTLYLLAKALPVFSALLSGREAGPIRGIY